MKYLSPKLAGSCEFVQDRNLSRIAVLSVVFLFLAVFSIPAFAQEATAVAVQTDTGEVSNLITGRQISDLAVNGTSLFQLAALAPGASSDITNYKDVPVGGDTSVSFNGQRTAHNVFMIDGGENYDR